MLVNIFAMVWKKRMGEFAFQVNAEKAAILIRGCSRARGEYRFQLNRDHN
jgi:hypothetical protein